MCDYSLHGVRNRPARIGEKLVTTDFGTGTRGFAAVDDFNTAVCVLPGTELAFATEVRYSGWTIRALIRELFAAKMKTPHTTAIFRQINVGQMAHHDALEFPDGKKVLLTCLCLGQEATVLQLPAAPRPAAETRRQKSVPILH